MVLLGLTEDEFARAFSEFQTFGPRRSIPIEIRWREELPGLDSAIIPRLVELCDEIEACAYTVAEQVVYGDLPDAAARKEILQRYPFLTDEQLKRTLNQACFFAAK